MAICQPPLYLTAEKKKDGTRVPITITGAAAAALSCPACGKPLVRRDPYRGYLCGEGPHVPKLLTIEVLWQKLAPWLRKQKQKTVKPLPDALQVELRDNTPWPCAEAVTRKIRTAIRHLLTILALQPALPPPAKQPQRSRKKAQVT